MYFASANIGAGSGNAAVIPMAASPVALAGFIAAVFVLHIVIPGAAIIPETKGRLASAVSVAAARFSAPPAPPPGAAGGVRARLPRPGVSCLND